MVKRLFITALISINFIAYAAAQATGVTIKQNNISVLEALDEVELQSEYTVAYDQKKVDLTGSVSLYLDNVKVTEALNAILKDRASYTIRRRHIFVLPKKEEPAPEPEIIRIEPSQPIVPIDQVAVVPRKYTSPSFTDVGTEAISFTPAAVASAPDLFGVKTNIFMDGAGVFNLGAELRIGNKLSFDVSAGLLSWNMSADRDWDLWVVQPELRYWLKRAFDGAFFGVHFNAGYGDFDKSDFSYKGDFYGAGLSYGYQWRVHHRWIIEAVAGIGYVEMKSKKYEPRSGAFIGDETRHYFGPTKAGVSLFFLIK